MCKINNLDCIWEETHKDWEIKNLYTILYQIEELNNDVFCNKEAINKSIEEMKEKIESLIKKGI